MKYENSSKLFITINYFRNIVTEKERERSLSHYYLFYDAKCKMNDYFAGCVWRLKRRSNIDVATGQGPLHSFQISRNFIISIYTLLLH